MNALEAVYIQLFHQRNTTTSEKTQKEGNPLFDLIYDIKCAWSDLHLTVCLQYRVVYCFVYISVHSLCTYFFDYSCIVMSNVF
jgi:hypothetical protein